MFYFVDILVLLNHGNANCCCGIANCSKIDSGTQMNTLLIILGASVGAPARYAIDQYIRRFTTKPYGTFTVNILGSFLIGLTFKSSESARDLLAIGFAGAFTTWSTFMLDLYLAYELRRYRDALINVGASLIFGLLAAWVGVQLVS